MKSLILRIVLSLGVAGLLLGLLMAFSDVRPADVWQTLRTLPPGIYLAALAVHLGIYLLRALRFGLLLPADSRPGFSHLLALSAAHNMASYLLPAKTGEASWMVYLRTHCGVRASTGVASLVVARLLDAAILCVCLALSCLWVAHSGRYESLDFLGVVGAALVAIMLVCATLAARGDWLVGAVSALLRVMRVNRWKLGERLLAALFQVALALRDAGRRHRLGPAALVTLPVWLGVFAFYWVLVLGLGMGVELAFPEIVFGSSLGVTANLLPVNATAGIGTQDAGWVLGFELLGIDRSASLPAGLAVHAVQLVNVCALGVLAHVFMGVLPRLQLDTAEELAADAELPAPDGRP